MSCYEEENGSLKLPAKSYQNVRRACVEALKVQKANEHKAALALRALCKAKGIRTGKLSVTRGTHKGTTLSNLSWKVASDYNVCEWTIRRLVNPDGERIVNPTKSHLKVKAAETSFDFGEASLRFNSKSKTVEWDVENNNRSCDRAYAHPVGRAFWRAIRSIEFTTKTGGVIWYTCEYSEERGPDRWSGTYYGGIGKREQKRRFGW